VYACIVYSYIVRWLGYGVVYGGACDEVLTILIRVGQGVCSNSIHTSIRGRQGVCPKSICLLKWMG